MNIKNHHVKLLCVCVCVSPMALLIIWKKTQRQIQWARALFGWGTRNTFFQKWRQGTEKERMPTEGILTGILQYGYWGAILLWPSRRMYLFYNIFISLEARRLCISVLGKLWGINSIEVPSFPYIAGWAVLISKEKSSGRKSLQFMV